MYQITKEKYYENLKKRFPEDDFTILQFTAAKDPVSIQCNKCKQIFNYNRGTTLYSHRRKHFCPLCNAKSVIEMREACERNNISIEKIAYNVTEPWTLHCNNCDTTFLRAPSGWLQKDCPNCGQYRSAYSKEQWQKIVDEHFGEGEFKLLEERPSSRRFFVQHKCGFIRKTQFHAFINSRGCPKCSNTISRGEQAIMLYLDSHKIRYEYQKRMGETLQFFDFYLPDYSIAIEFNGIQHYMPIEFFGGAERFKMQQQYDSNKAKYCKENNIQLESINYKQYGEINTILAELLKKFNDQSLDVDKN